MEPCKVTDTAGYNFISLGQGLPHFTQQLRHADTVKVAFLGGSITHMKGWRDLVMRYLVSHYPGRHFSFLDAGIPSLGSLPHAFRLQKDVLDKMHPDLLFIESAVNDQVNGTPRSQQIRSLEGIVRHTREISPRTDMVLMAFADEVKNKYYSAGIVPETVLSHQLVASHYGLPFINLAKQVFTQIQEGRFSWEKDFKDLHPAPFGQQLYFEAIKRLLTKAEKADEQENIAAAAKSRPRPVPVPVQKVVPIDPYSYSSGEYLDIRRGAHLSGFRYETDWVPEDHAHVRPGFVHIPVLEGRKPGDSFNLDFKGTAVGLAVLSGPDAGVVRYRVDGTAWKYLDLYTQWSSSLHLPWYKMLADGLNPGRHQLVVEVVSRKEKAKIEAAQARKLPQTVAPTGATISLVAKGTAVRIVYFLVNGDRREPTWKIIHPETGDRDRKY
jgi:sialidase-1